MNRLFVLFIFLLFSSQSRAQNTSADVNWLKRLEQYEIKPVLAAQMWATYTNNQLRWNEEKAVYEKVDNRLNFLFRRIRFGLKATPYKDLSIRVIGAFDFVGRDVLSGFSGGANNSNLPSFDMWEAYFHWKMNKKDHLNLIGGYFPVQLGRESMTSALSVTSLEKIWSQNYIRRHLVGRGPGRSMGLNLGGLFYKPEKKVSLRYDLGIYNPVYYDLGGNSVGSAFSPLLSGRLSLSIGDPEQSSYRIGYKINYFSERRGLTISAATAWQGTTDFYDRNTAYNFDLLFNWNNWNVDAEWTLLQRAENSNLGSSQARHLRVSYNVNIKNQSVLEPLLMVMQFDGATDAEAQAEAMAVNTFSGVDHNYDFGVNWYLHPQHLKLSLHYTWHEGNNGDLGDGKNVNNLYYQSTAGAIRKGDWLGLGMVLRL